MNNESRINSSIKNAITGIAVQGIIILLNLLTRGIFIKCLSVEYLGINGLFTNILTILSLAELGVGSAMVYSMYRPLALNDKETLKSLMKLYAKAYKIIGLVICLLGLGIVPFLSNLIGDAIYIPNIYLIYILFLINTVCSYFFAYKRSIISADQKEYINSMYKSKFAILKCIFQIICLYLTNNFVLFTLIQIICTFLENYFISRKANQLYPYLKEKEYNKLDKGMQREVFINVKSLMIYKISGVLLGGIDNIIISMFIGISTVGLLSNYTLIISSINMILTQLFNALTASIGNLVAKEDGEKQEFIFDILFFTCFWIYGFCSICLVVLLKPFITLWVGQDYVLTQVITLVIVLNFYIVGMQTAVWTYRSTMGLFRYGKWRPVISAVINLIVSIVLVKKIGVIGVLLGTTISRTFTNIWYDPVVIYKYGFKKPVWGYYLKYIKYLFITLIALIGTIMCTVSIEKINIINFLIMMLITIIVPNIIILIGSYKTKEFKYLLRTTQEMITKIVVKVIKDKEQLQ